MLEADSEAAVPWGAIEFRGAVLGNIVEVENGLLDDL